MSFVKNMGIWHTRREKNTIKSLGGKPLTKFGTDGELNGRPVEHRTARKDKRFRIGKKTHKKLVRKDGNYIFEYKGRTKVVPAKRVSKLIGRGKWLKDRGYPHKFVKVRQVFGEQNGLFTIDSIF